MPANPSVLFVHEGKERDPGSRIQLLPMGVPSMADWLTRHGHRARVVHAGVERAHDPGFDPVACVRSAAPRLLALDLHWHAQSAAVIDLAERIHVVLPELPIVLGGYTASAFADEILRDHPAVRFVVRGDGELALCALADALAGGGALDGVPNLAWRDGGQVRHSRVVQIHGADELARLRFCAFEALDHASTYNRAGAMEGRFDPTGDAAGPGIFYCNCGRGCPYDCLFCGGSRSSQRAIGGRQRVVYRPIEAMVDDLARMPRFGLASWYNTFHPSADDRYFLELFAAIRARGLRLHMIHECLHLPTSRFLDAFAATFGPRSRLDLVVASGSQAVRRRVKGNAFDDAGLLDALERIAARGIAADLCFLTGLPTEGRGDAGRSRELVRAARARHPDVGVQAELLAVEPCAPMQVDPDAAGIRATARSFADFRDGHRRARFVGFEPGWGTVAEADAAAASIEAAGRTPAPAPTVTRRGRGELRVQLHDVNLFDGGPRRGLGIPSLIAHAEADLALRGRVAFEHVAWAGGRPGVPEPAPSALVARALAGRPDVVGFTLTTWSERLVRSSIRLLRVRAPGVRLIVGGPLATGYGPRWLEQEPATDALVSGYGERPFAAWLAGQLDGDGDGDGGPVPGLYLRDGGAVVGEAQRAGDVPGPDEVPSPYRAGLVDPAGASVMHAAWARGCPGRCGYCGWGQQLREVKRASAARIADDVAFARERGVRELAIDDAALNDDADALEQLCEALAAATAGGGPAFSGFLRYEWLDARQLRALRTVSWRRLTVGLQTDDDAGLRAIGRPRFDRERFAWVIAELARFTRPGVQLITALPGDRRGAFLRRLAHLRGLDCDLTVFPLQLPPGCALWRRREELGVELLPDAQHVVASTPTLSARAHLDCLRVAPGVSADPAVLRALEQRARAGPPRVALHQADVHDGGANFGLGVPHLIAHARRQPDLVQRVELCPRSWDVDHPDHFRDPVETIVEAALDDEPAAVGFSLQPWSYHVFLAAIAAIKRRRPALPVIVGGPNACIEGAALLEAHPGIDVLVPGEGELPFADLLRVWLERGFDAPGEALAAVAGVIARGADGAPSTAQERVLPDGGLDYCGAPLADGLVPLLADGGQLNVEWTRGCPHTCTYCAWPRRQTRRRRFSAAHIAGDLAWARRHGFAELLICDAAINATNASLASLVEALVAGDPERALAFGAFLDWMRLDDAQAKTMAPLRWSRLMLGLQTDDEQGLAALGRRPFDRDRFEAAVEAARPLTTPYIELMTGVPGDTRDKIVGRLEYALGLGCRVSMFPLQATRGTAIWSTCRGIGATIDDRRQWVVRSLPTMAEEAYRAAIDHALALGLPTDQLEIAGYEFLGLAGGEDAARASAPPPPAGEIGVDDRAAWLVQAYAARAPRLVRGHPLARWRPDGRPRAVRAAQLAGARLAFTDGKDRVELDAYPAGTLERPLACGATLAFCPASEGQAAGAGATAARLLCRALARLDGGRGR